jgi:thymidylate synthase
MTVNQREHYYEKKMNMSDEDAMFPNASDEEVNDTLNEWGCPKYYLDCKMIQRSCDTFLGVPYNIASYAFLTHIIAKLVNMVPGEFIWSGNSVHIYENHFDQVKEQLSRIPFSLSQLQITGNWKSIDDIKFEDFQILNYQSHDKIIGELSTGLKK